MDERYKPWHDKAIKSIDYLQEMADRNPENGTCVYSVCPSAVGEHTKPFCYIVKGDVRDWKSHVKYKGELDVAERMRI